MGLFNTNRVENKYNKPGLILLEKMKKIFYR